MSHGGLLFGHLRKMTALVILCSLLLLGDSSVGFAQSAPPDLVALRSISEFQAKSKGSETRASWDDRTGRARFVTGQFATGLTASEGKLKPEIAARKIALEFGAPFGLDKVVNDIRIRRAYADEVGFDHIVLEQRYRNIPILGSEIRIHLQGSDLRAMNGAIAESIELQSLKPDVSRHKASQIAQRLHPGSKVSAGPSLTILSHEVDKSLTKDHLVWQVTTIREKDDSSFEFLLDAGTGVPVRKVNNTKTLVNRQIYDLMNTHTWPVTPFATEGSPPPPTDVDADLAYDYSGIVYNHFSNAYAWRSHDNQDSALTIGVRVSTSGIGDNAYWSDSRKALGFTPGMVVLDIMAHEFTHGVISGMGGKLNYYGQPGALNESYADIFGVIIDSGDYWLGEDSAAGTIRSMSFPDFFGYIGPNGPKLYPKNANDYRCYPVFDNGGVHINSNIHNYAAYLIMTSIGRSDSGRIFFRALRDYLGVFSDFADARDAAIASATDLWGATSVQTAAVVAGFTQIGLPPLYGPPRCTGGTVCSATLVPPEAPDPTGDDPDPPWPNPGDQCNPICPIDFAGISFYDIRDDLLEATPYGSHLVDKYYQHTARVNEVLVADLTLLAEAGSLMWDMAPGLADSAAGEVTAEAVFSASASQRLQNFISDIIAADGGGALATDLSAESGSVDWAAIEGMTYADALDYLDANWVTGPPDPPGDQCNPICP